MIILKFQHNHAEPLQDQNSYLLGENSELQENLKWVKSTIYNQPPYVPAGRGWLLFWRGYSLKTGSSIGNQALQVWKAGCTRAGNRGNSTIHIIEDL